MPHLKDLTVEWVSLVDRAAVRDPSDPSQPQRFVLLKRDGATNTPGGEMSTPTVEELSADLQKAQDERDEAIAKSQELAARVADLEKAAKKTAKKDEPKTINKAELPKEVREALEKAEAEASELRKAAEKAEEIAKAERELRIEKEFIAKAEEHFPHVAGDTSEFGKLLKSASEKFSKEEYDALEQRLRSAEEQVTKGELFAEYGRSGDPTPGAAGESDVRSLTEKAQEIRKADPSLTEYEAMHLAMTKDREAQARYLGAVR